MSMMPLRRLFAVALVCMLSSSREVSADTCAEMTVVGGASPGTYEVTDDILEDRNVYTQTVDGEIVAIFRFYEGSLSRRLEEGFEGMDDGMAANEALEHLSGPSRGSPALRVAGEAAAAGRSLADCATGFWANFEGDGASSTSTANTNYPFFVTADCADDPSGVSAEWLSVACVSCEQVSDEVTITCTSTVEDADAENSASSLGAGAGMFLAVLSTAFVAHVGAFFLW